MADAPPPLYPPRYFRCQSAECGRKWHRMSMGAKSRVAHPTNLFQAIVEIEPKPEGACPACGAKCEPEPGCVYGDHPPPQFEIKTVDNAKWSYVE